VVREVRIAVGSVAPTVLRARAAEGALRGRAVDGATIARARDALGSEIAPIDDLRSSVAYRRTVACNLLEEFLAG
jgi:xanthine dehydrogenase iron-sulfur cluster and FAD-binding subunit A